jgi:hypothetical protein
MSAAGNVSNALAAILPTLVILKSFEVVQDVTKNFQGKPIKKSRKRKSLLDDPFSGEFDF